MSYVRAVNLVSTSPGRKFIGSVNPMKNHHQPGSIKNESHRHIIQRIGLRENLQERPIFNWEIHGFLQIFP